MLSRRVQVSYYGDADFATEDVMLVHDVNMADDPTVDVTAMLHSLPVEVQTLFSKLRKTWMEKVRARMCTCACVGCMVWRVISGVRSGVCVVEAVRQLHQQECAPPGGNRCQGLRW